MTVIRFSWDAMVCLSSRLAWSKSALRRQSSCCGELNHLTNFLGWWAGGENTRPSDEPYFVDDIPVVYWWFSMLGLTISGLLRIMCYPSKLLKQIQVEALMMI